MGRLPDRLIAVFGAALVLATVFAVGFAGGGGNLPSTARSRPRAATGTGTAVSIQNFLYRPADLTVRVGTRVTVTNLDQVEHTLTADSAGGGSFDSGTLDSGHPRATITFEKVGTFTYHCDFHPFMHGTITVR